MITLLQKRSVSCRWNKFLNSLSNGKAQHGPLKSDPVCRPLCFVQEWGQAWGRVHGFWLSKLGHLEGEKKIIMVSYISWKFIMLGTLHVIPWLVLKISYSNRYYHSFFFFFFFFYRWGNWDTKTLSNLPKFKEITNNGGRIPGLSPLS